MTEKLTKDQKVGIVQALDEALDKAPWAASTFLSIIGKKLRLLRDEVAESIEDNVDEAKNRSSQSSRKLEAGRSGQMKMLYVSVYAFDGSNIQSWERILQHLPNQVISRPVYENEEDVIASIRSKNNRMNEAYVAIYVDPQYILAQPPEKISIDRLGKPLLLLKDKAINLDNVDVFVHQTGTYRFVSGRLVKK